MSKISLDPVFLGLLAHEACHGYQILSHFRDANRLSTVWDLSTSQLYSTLKRLESKGYIEGYEDYPLDAPMRLIYELTDKGKLQVENWLNQASPSASTRAIRTEFLSRLYISRLLKRPTEDIIARQKKSCEAHRKNLILRRDSLPAGVGYLSLDLRVREMTLIMGWLEIAETMFSKEQRL